jgi:aspartate/methionine/tyrosine aminotransferase
LQKHILAIFLFVGNRYPWVFTIGSKEGLANLAQAVVGSGDTVLVPNPAYPIHPYGFVIAGADIQHVPCGPICQALF